MEDGAILWNRRDAAGGERRCTVTIIGEGEFELRLWAGSRLVVCEDFEDEAALLDRASELERIEWTEAG